MPKLYKIMLHQVTGLTRWNSRI